MSLDTFLANCPASSSELDASLQDFVSHNSTSKEGGPRPIVCVTSGGTTVPLEKRCVRFIDNFSAGSRGAQSAEEFLENGYAVVFLTRDQSLQPFSQIFGANATAAEVLSSALEVGSGGEVIVKDQHKQEIKAVLEKVAKVRNEKLLLQVQFTTVFDYLEKLQRIGIQLKPYGAKAMFYLAAAVSDFYIPWEKLSDHKIQSRDQGGCMRLDLEVVPKALGVLCDDWTPDAFVVSFKLETDDNLLLEKARGAIEKYHVHAVVANILKDRKQTVKVVKPGGPEGFTVEQLDLDPQSKYLEVPLVKAVAELHKQFQL